MRLATCLPRRRFLRSTILTTGAAWLLPRTCIRAALAGPVDSVSRVSLAAGADHTDIVLQALLPFKKQIAAAIGNRTVLIKPNNVIGTPNNGHGEVLLSDTPVQALEAILDFLCSIGKTDIVIAEACATDPTMVAFQNCGYFQLPNYYPVRLMDLNQGGHEVVRIYRGTGTQNIRISKMLQDPDHFAISVTRPKSHNNIVATLTLKNIVMSSPIVDVGKYRNVANCKADKGSMHGNSNQDLHDNLHLLASRMAPDLAVLDAFEGMEGNGPCWGTAVSKHCALAGLDFLAVDRVGLELMGVDPTWPAYLSYCYQTGLGQYDLSKIEILGPAIDPYRYSYRLHDNIETQLGMRSTPRT